MAQAAHRERGTCGPCRASLALLVPQMLMVFLVVVLVKLTMRLMMLK